MKTKVEALMILAEKLGAQEDATPQTVVDALKVIYETLGGEGDLNGVQTIAEMIQEVASVAENAGGGGGGAKTVVILPEQTVTLAVPEGESGYCQAAVTLDKEPDPNYDVDVTFDGNAVTLQYRNGFGYTNDSLALYYNTTAETWLFGAQSEEAVGAHTVKIVQTKGMEEVKHGSFTLVNSSDSDIAIRVHIGSYAYSGAAKNLARGDSVNLPCEYKVTGESGGISSGWNASALYACLPIGTASEFGLGPVSGSISASDVSLVKGGLDIHATRVRQSAPTDGFIGTIEIYAHT